MINNYIITKEGLIISRYTGKALSPSVDKKGYNRVTLKHKGESKTFLVHRLVAMKYIDNPFNKPQVNHLDGNKSNNNYWNLEWCTCQENNDHAVATDLVKRGKDRPNSKLSDEQVIEMRQLREEEGLNYYKLGAMFKVSYQTAHKVCTRQVYTHI